MNDISDEHDTEYVTEKCVCNVSNIPVGKIGDNHSDSRGATV